MTLGRWINVVAAALGALGSRPSRRAVDELAGLFHQGGDHAPRLDPLGGEAAMLQGVLVALGSPAGGPVHPADAMTPNRRRLAL